MPCRRCSSQHREVEHHRGVAVDERARDAPPRRPSRRATNRAGAPTAPSPKPTASATGAVLVAVRRLALGLAELQRRRAARPSPRRSAPGGSRPRRGGRGGRCPAETSHCAGAPRHPRDDLAPRRRASETTPFSLLDSAPVRTAKPSPTSIRSARQRREVRRVRGVLELGVVAAARLGACTSSHSASSGAASWIISGSIAAPACTSRCAIRRWSVPPPATGPGEWNEPWAVHISGVAPPSASRAGSAPRASSAATTSPWPHHAAWCSGVPPRSPGRSIGTPSSSRISDRLAPALGRRLVQRLGELGPHALGARRVCAPRAAAPRRGRRRSRARSARRPARPRAARRARPAARRGRGGPSATRARTACARSAASHAFTSAPASTSIRSTSGERPR